MKGSSGGAGRVSLLFLPATACCPSLSFVFPTFIVADLEHFSFYIILLQVFLLVQLMYCPYPDAARQSAMTPFTPRSKSAPPSSLDEVELVDVPIEERLPQDRTARNANRMSVLSQASTTLVRWVPVVNFWVALVCVTVAAFLMILDTSILSTAVSHYALPLKTQAANVTKRSRLFRPSSIISTTLPGMPLPFSSPTPVSCL